VLSAMVERNKDLSHKELKNAGHITIMDKYQLLGWTKTIVRFISADHQN